MIYEDEEWKPIDIKGFEGLYKISNYGKVINVKRNKLVKPYGRTDNIILYNNNQRTITTTARLVLKHFKPLKPEEGHEEEYSVKRINKDKNNICYNHPSNLYWKKYKFITKISVKYNGVDYKNIYEFCEKNNINLEKQIIRDRINNGWTPEEILKIPKLNRAEIAKISHVYWYKYYGKLYTTKQLAEISGLTLAAFKGRIKSGWSIEQAVDTPLLRKSTYKGGRKKCKEN